MKRLHGYRRAVAFVAVGVAILSLGLVLKELPGTAPIVSASRDTPNTIRHAFDASFKAGVTALQSGRPADAVEHFRKIHRLGPHVPEVQVNLGYAYLALKDFAAAERVLRLGGKLGGARRFGGGAWCDADLYPLGPGGRPFQTEGDGGRLGVGRRPQEAKSRAPIERRGKGWP
jgi:hypothetical protein